MQTDRPAPSPVQRPALTGVGNPSVEVAALPLCPLFTDRPNLHESVEAFWTLLNCWPQQPPVATSAKG